MWNISTECRLRRKKRMPGEQASDTSMTLHMEIDKVMKLAIDRLVSELTDRSRQLQDLNARFGILLDIKKLIMEDIDEQIL